MQAISVGEEEMYSLIDEKHNPPIIQTEDEEGLFQAEIHLLHERLLESLSPLGQEGDYYGISDFAVRPDLKIRPTVIPPPAPHVRQFCITILTERFFRSDYLRVLHDFLLQEAQGYRLWIDQDFARDWIQTIILTANLARVYCTNANEAVRLNEILARL